MAGDEKGPSTGSGDPEVTPELIYSFTKAEELYDQYLKTLGKMYDAVLEHSEFFTLQYAIQYTPLGRRRHDLIHGETQ